MPCTGRDSHLRQQSQGCSLLKAGGDLDEVDDELGGEDAGGEQPCADADMFVFQVTERAGQGEDTAHHRQHHRQYILGGFHRDEPDQVDRDNDPPKKDDAESPLFPADKAGDQQGGEQKEEAEHFREMIRKGRAPHIPAGAVIIFRVVEVRVISRAHLAGFLREDGSHVPPGIGTEKERTAPEDGAGHNQDKENSFDHSLSESQFFQQNTAQQADKNREEKEESEQTGSSGQSDKEGAEVKIPSKAKTVALQKIQSRTDKQQVQPVRMPESLVVLQ